MIANDGYFAYLGNASMGNDESQLNVWFALEQGDLCTFLQNYLRHKGYFPRCISEFDSLRSELQTTQPDILLIDEEFDGHRLESLIKCIGPHIATHTSLILVSRASKMNYRHRLALLQLEPCAILPYPFTTSELRVALATARDNLEWALV